MLLPNASHIYESVRPFLKVTRFEPLPTLSRSRMSSGGQPSCRMLLHERINSDAVSSVDGFARRRRDERRRRRHDQRHLQTLRHLERQREQPG